MYEDRALIGCIKPAGVSSESAAPGGEGMPELLQSQCGAQRIFCVHRLDKPVCGAMVYAKDGKTAAAISAMLGERHVLKQYLAVVHGVPDAPAATLRDLLFHDRTKNKTYVVQRPRRGVKDAELDYTLLQTVQTERGALSLLRITLHTGRTHQIRAQFAARRLPLVGDNRYGSPLRGGNLALLSHRLRLPHPLTGEILELCAPAPDAWPWTLFSPVSDSE